MSDSELLATAGEWSSVVASKSGVANATPTKEAVCRPTSTPCSPHFMCFVDDLLPKRSRAGLRPPRISDSELVTLAAAQVLLDCAKERRFLRFAKREARPSLPLHPRPVRLQQAAARRWRGEVCLVLNAARPQLALLLQPVAVVRLDPGPLRPVARDGQALPAGLATPPTATAPRTPATSGASASTCSARPTGCRSPSAWRRQTSRKREVSPSCCSSHERSKAARS